MKPIKILFGILLILLGGTACSSQAEQDLPGPYGQKDNDQEYAYTYIVRGDDLFERGDYDQAIEHYKIALELDPENSAVYNNLGLAYNYSNLFDQAVEAFDHALAQTQTTRFIVTTVGITIWNWVITIKRSPILIA